MDERINVTKSFLPPIEEYKAYLDTIWKSGQLTNQGPLLKQFEAEAADYLNVKNFHFVANGTIALQVALKALGIEEGEIITTPFSYVATTSAILWERCTPVFVDIEPETFCINPKLIEAAITPNTKAILAVHVFGNPCDVEKIEEIAKKHNLKVIYDGAHAFGVTYKGRSLLNYGDISTCSFHSTKPFHTIEGGAVIAKNKAISEKVELIKRFGHNQDNHFQLGINAKASEFQAAMGLVNLKYVDRIISKRSEVSAWYNDFFEKELFRSKIRQDTENNYAYYPVLLDDEQQLLKVLDILEKKNIYPRRYFYPSLNTLPYLNASQLCPISEDISKRILCLPLYPDLDMMDVKKICNEILQVFAEKV